MQIACGYEEGVSELKCATAKGNTPCEFHSSGVAFLPSTKRQVCFIANWAFWEMRLGLAAASWLATR
jgi:hypothetical protein